MSTIEITTPPLNGAHPLAEASNGDAYFVHPDLEAGKRLVQRDRWVKIDHHDNHVRVALCDDEACTMEAEWGAGDTVEEAWRFALGAAMGPIDEEYDEQHLIAWLQIV